jgi:uncharacterized protein (DUF1800 family)
MARSHPLLQAYKPTPEDPFDAVKAYHLMNRAGFGGTPAEIDKVCTLGPAGALEWLFDFPDANADEMSRTDVPNLSAIADYPKDFNDLRKQLVGKTEEEKKAFRQKLMQANREAVVATGNWWLKRMAYGPYPLHEKLVLFWHGHFTTSAKDERSALAMWNQNELHRRMGAGNFGQYVKQISRDPAMLDYLNNSQNRKAHPNENYARELMELFTLGIGNYTEDDIKQAARAFTGWAHDGDDFVFRKFDHDTGEKTFMGLTGNFDGDDIIDIILHRPVCANYIAGKLYKFFVCEEVPDDLLNAMGDILRESNFEIRPLLRTIFASKAFYQPSVIGCQIKSPVQLVVGTIRQLGLSMPGERAIQGSLNQMGQVPLYPPNVKGWPGGRQWINTSTLFVRYNTAVWLAGGSGQFATMNAKGGGGRTFPARDTGFRAGTGDSPEQCVDQWVARLIGRPIDADKRQVLIDALEGRANREDNVRKMVQLLVSMPDYQLC